MSFYELVSQVQLCEETGKTKENKGYYTRRPWRPEARPPRGATWGNTRVVRRQKAGARRALATDVFGVSAGKERQGRLDNLGHVRVNTSTSSGL